MLLKETPLNGTTQFKEKQIVLQFDEYIQLDNVAENVLISPPQQHPPIVKAIGKRVVVTFEEDLLDSTTYTIDFGQAICDNNEKNSLGNYSFSFATGEYIDSLAMFGHVYNAANLNPVRGVIVGVHSNLNDSVFEKQVFTRIAKSDSSGHFGVLNLREGNYRIYALRDNSKDYIYQPSEALAFTDSVYTPELEIEMHIDSVSGDTLYEPYHVPEDITLMLFEEDKQRHYFMRVLRDKEQHYFTLLFSAKQDTLPVIRALRAENELMQIDSITGDTIWSDSAWVDFTKHARLQACPTNDTIVYWLLDSIAIGMDSIRFEMTYLKSDSLYNLVKQTDTILAVWREPRMSDKAREKKRTDAINRKVTFKTNSSNKFDIYNNLTLFTETPLADWNTDCMHLMLKRDTSLVPVPFVLHTADESNMQLKVEADLAAEQTYQFMIDSGAVHDIYGKINMPYKVELKLRAIEEYATLTIQMAHYDPLARIQIINEKDQVVREKSARPEGTKFEYLEAKSYYVRLYIDLDGNGQWTTGDWLKKRQPEPVYYLNKKITLRANWDFEETFDHTITPAIEQKPKELRKIETGQTKK